MDRPCLNDRIYRIENAELRGANVSDAGAVKRQHVSTEARASLDGQQRTVREPTVASAICLTPAPHTAESLCSSYP